MTFRPVGRYRAIQRALLCAVLGSCSTLSGCTLLTIKSPEIPLTPREQEARLLTRDYAAHFVATMTQVLDATSGDDAAVRAQALRLKLGAVSEITRTSTGLSPIVSLLDTWAFALQFSDYMGATGAAVLGAEAAAPTLAAHRLAADADALAHHVAGADYPRYQHFVAAYAEKYPLVGPDLARPSVLSAWIEVETDKGPLRAEGTVAQALGDVSDRLRIYGERVPALGLWQAELALDHAGIDAASYRTALHNLDAQLERISRLADSSPALAHEAIVQLRGSLHESTQRLDGAWMQTLRSVTAEREALTADIAAERLALTAAFDSERVRITADANQIAATAVDTSWRELRKLVREALLLTIVLALVMLGLPFAAGYLAGRRTTRRSQ